jgi:hypothetical protein
MNAVKKIHNNPVHEWLFKQLESEPHKIYVVRFNNGFRIEYNYNFEIKRWSISNGLDRKSGNLDSKDDGIINIVRVK